MQQLPDDRMRCTLKRELAGQQLVKEHSQRIDVSTVIHRVRFAAGLFRRHVRGSTDNLPVKSQRHIAF